MEAHHIESVEIRILSLTKALHQDTCLLAPDHPIHPTTNMKEEVAINLTLMGCTNSKLMVGDSRTALDTLHKDNHLIMEDHMAILEEIIINPISIQIRTGLQEILILTTKQVTYFAIGDGHNPKTVGLAIPMQRYAKRNKASIVRGNDKRYHYF